MIRRLRIKFVCINMAIVLLLLSGILGTVLRLDRANHDRESIRTMQAFAFAPPGARLPDAPGARLPDAPPGVIHLPCFTLREGRGGRLIADGSNFFDLSDETVLRELYTLVLDAEKPSGIFPDYSLRYLRAETPGGLCAVFADASGELSSRRSLLRSCLLIGSAGAAAFLLVSVMLSFWAVHPVSEAWAQQRQFVSDASHELKTPLTVILTNAELLRDASCSPAAQAQAVSHILSMSRQMRGLIESLLELARADGGLPRQCTAVFDLSHALTCALLPFEPVYFEKGLCLSERIEAGIYVRGSETHFKQVLEIFLDNAQKYASAGGEVTVTLRRMGKGRCQLSVANPGEALSPAQLRDIFKRFYRVDQARSQDGSYGLGLSIAEAVVRRHRGRIWAESAGGCNTFFVQLPTVPAP
ncbi:MAG: HAMP domain-containing histidine kinase [Clostridiaceae bacterium]|nr:HAMP domain-containing histidine kinase [Clostridiaceae bacterium]